MVSTEAENSLTLVTRPDVTVCVAKTDISTLSLVLHHEWPVAERAYAFHTNKNAMKAIDADVCLKIDMLLACSSINLPFANGMEGNGLVYSSKTG